MRGVNVRHRIRRQDVGVFALSVPLLVLSAVAVWQTADPIWQVPCLVAIAVLHLALLVRSWFPWVTLLLTGIGALALLGSPAIPASVMGLPGPWPAILLPSTAMFGVAIYSVAAHARTSRWLAAALGLAGVAEVVAVLWNGIPWLVATRTPEVWRLGVALLGTLAVLLVFACGRWRALATKTDDLRRRATDANEQHVDPLDAAVSRQHARVAREVQRAVVHNLDEILSRAREGRLASRRAPAIADDALAEITQQGEEALGRVQSLLSLLDDPDPAVLDEHDETMPSPLAAEHAFAPQPQLGDLPKLIDAARGEGLTVSLGVEGERGDLPVAAQLALYRTAQEALTNTVRHAGPGAVAQVELQWESDEVAVTIEDEIPGGVVENLVFDAPDYVEGHGLRVVRERLEAAGGYLDVDQLDGGYRVRGAVPRTAQPA